MPWKIRSPIARKDEEVLDPNQVRQQKLEAGFQGIESGVQLQIRLAIEQSIIRQRVEIFEKELLKIQNKTSHIEEDKLEIKRLETHIIHEIESGGVHLTAAAFSTPGEDHDMSERYFAYEKWTSLEQDNPSSVIKATRFGRYLRDISFKKEHVQIPSTILTQIPVLLGQGGYNTITPTSQLGKSEKPSQEPRSDTTR